MRRRRVRVRFWFSRRLAWFFVVSLRDGLGVEAVQTVDRAVLEGEKIKINSSSGCVNGSSSSFEYWWSCARRQVPAVIFEGFRTGESLVSGINLLLSPAINNPCDTLPRVLRSPPPWQPQCSRAE